MRAPVISAVGRDESAALIITHAVRAGEERRYEDWLADILGAVGSAPGYVGREIFRPAAGTSKYTTIVRFDTADNLRAWAGSDARRSFIERVSGMLEEGDRYEIRTGFDFWFTPEGVPAPKRWKQIILTVTAVYPLSLLIPRLLAPLFNAAPSLDRELIRALFMATILTTLLTLIMPPYTRLVRRWLFDKAR